MAINTKVYLKKKTYIFIALTLCFPFKMDALAKLN